MSRRTILIRMRERAKERIDAARETMLRLSEPNAMRAGRDADQDAALLAAHKAAVDSARHTIEVIDKALSAPDHAGHYK